MLMRRAFALVCCATLLLPLSALWTQAGFHRFVLPLVCVMFIVTAVGPARGLIALAGLFPLAAPLAVLAGDASLSEALLLAFLAAAVLRLLLEPPLPALSQLRRPALLFGCVIAAASAVALSTLQQHIADVVPFLAEMGRHVARDYFWADSFEPLRVGLGWLEAIALAIVAESLLRRHVAVGPSVVRMLLLSGGALAAFSALRLGEIALRSETPVTTAASVLWGHRFNPFYADLNAAASLYALLLVPSLWLFWNRRHVWAAVVTLALALALWLAGSRAAMAAVIVSLAIVWLVASRPRRRTLFVAACGGLALVAVVAGLSERNLALGSAASFRVEMTKAAFAITARAPVFGVGLNEFKPQSAEVFSDRMRLEHPWAAQGENAHNNFLQILAELGLVGLVVFVWCLAPLGRNLRPTGHVSAQSPEALGLAGGVLAFLLSALFGHPLLLTHVRQLFFLALGTATALSFAPRPNPSGGRWEWRAFAFAGLVVLAFLPSRVATARQGAALAGVIYGASDPAGPVDGVAYRIAEKRSSWFLSSEARTVQIPLRAAASTAPCQVSVMLDGRDADVAIAEAERWRTLGLELPPLASARRWRRLDLVVTDGDCRLMVGILRVRP